MNLDHITRKSVIDAIQEYNLVGPIVMIDRYGGGLSWKWYIRFERRVYDQKLILRAANIYAGGSTPDEDLKAGKSRECLRDLEFRIVKICPETARCDDQSVPRG